MVSKDSTGNMLVCTALDLEKPNPRLNILTFTINCLVWQGDTGIN